MTIQTTKLLGAVKRIMKLEGMTLAGCERQTGGPHPIARQYSIRAAPAPSERGFERSKAEVNGVSLYYEKAGFGDHPVLFFPGSLGTTVTDFGPQLQTFDADRYTLLCFEQRGYGRSIPPERDFPLDFLRRDAVDAYALMQKLGYKQFSLVGWSGGGVSSIHLAAMWPEAVRKLVFFSTFAFMTPELERIFQALKNVKNLSADMVAAYTDFYKRHYREDYWPRKWIELADAYSNFVRDNDNEICAKDLPKIKCPTLVLHGRKDPFIPVKHAYFMKERVPGARLYIFPEGKHNPHLRYPTEFNNVVDNFLQE